MHSDLDLLPYLHPLPPLGFQVLRPAQARTSLTYLVGFLPLPYFFC